MAKPKTPTPPVAHHYLRTTVAGLFGTIAMVLISASILVVWANRTLTDTPTFVQTVAPVIQRPELQEFVAQKVSQQILAAAPGASTDVTLYPADIHDSVVQILKSPRVVAAWKSNNETAHAELIRQLDANAPEAILDLDPLVSTVLDEMKQTKLAPLADKIDLKPGAAEIDLKGSSIDKVRASYRALKDGTLTLVLLTLVCAGLSVWISVHHTKTLRRILTGTGLSALVTAGMIQLPSVVTLPGDAVTAKLALALVGTILHGLQLALLALGAVCLLGAVASKVYEVKHP